MGGFIGGVETLASLSAPLMGGALIDGWTWRACYVINLPIGLARFTLIALFLNIPDFDLPWKVKTKDLDILGTAVFVPTMTSFLLAME